MAGFVSLIGIAAAGYLTYETSIDVSDLIDQE